MISQKIWIVVLIKILKNKDTLKDLLLKTKCKFTRKKKSERKLG